MANTIPKSKSQSTFKGGEGQKMVGPILTPYKDCIVEYKGGKKGSK
jgi:hypothetical protein